MLWLHTWLCYERGHSRRVGAAALVRAAAQQLPDLARDDGVVGALVVDDLWPAPGVLAQLAGADIAARHSEGAVWSHLATYGVWCW